MNLIESFALLVASFALLFFGRGRSGEALPILQKMPWVVGQLFCLIDIVFVRCWSHGHRSKSELATLRILYRASGRYELRFWG